MASGRLGRRVDAAQGAQIGVPSRNMTSNTVAPAAAANHGAVRADTRPASASKRCRYGWSVAHRTPVLTSRTLNDLVGGSVFGNEVPSSQNRSIM